MLGPHKLSSTIRELEDKLNALKLEVHPKHTISLLTQAFANKTPTETGEPFFRLPERESASDFLNTQLTSDKLAFPAIFHPSIVLAQAVRQSFHDLYGETEGDLRFDTLFGSSTTLTPQNRRLLLSPLWMGTAYQRFDKTSRPFPLQPLTYVLNTATESELDLTTDEAWDPAHVENLLRGDSQEVVLALTQFWGEQLETTLMTLALSSKMPVDAPISLPNLEPKIEHFDFDDSKQFHQLF